MSIDLIRDPSSTNFPQCNFPRRVTGCPTRSAFSTRRENLHINWFDQRSLFHELSSMQFSTGCPTHSTFSTERESTNNFITIASQFLLRALKKKRWILSLSHFFFFLLLNFLLFLNSRVYEILFIYNSTLHWCVLVLYFLSLLFSSYNLCWS